MVVADVSENYSFVVYCKHSDTICHLSYVFISDCLQHNTVAVYPFQKKLISFFGSNPLHKNCLLLRWCCIAVKEP